MNLILMKKRYKVFLDDDQKENTKLRKDDSRSYFTQYLEQPVIVL